MDMSNQPVIGNLRVVRLLIEGNIKNRFPMILAFLDPEDPASRTYSEYSEYLRSLAKRRNPDAVRICSIKESAKLNSVARELFSCLHACEGIAGTDIDKALLKLESLIHASWILKESVAQTA